MVIRCDGVLAEREEVLTPLQCLCKPYNQLQLMKGVGLSQGSLAEKPNVQCFCPNLESNNVTHVQERSVILN